MKWVLMVLGVISAAEFVLCGIDKWKAKKDRWRIPEKTLFLLAFCGGGWGLWLGMTAFRHKTRHLSFEIIAPLTSVLWGIGILALAWYWI